MAEEALTIVFDLDGTLVDTAPDLIAVADSMLEEMGLAPLDPVKGRRAAGRGARALLTAGLKAAGRPLPGDDAWPELIGTFIRRYRGRIAERSRPFPGVADFLALMRARGHRLAVCTNKRAALAGELLAALGMADHFAAVIGGDSVGRGKPDPAPLLHGIRAAGGHPRRAVIIGDSMADVLAARAAGVTSVLAAWGYLDRPPAAYQADFCIHAMDEALPVIAELAGDGPAS